jgi:hypothetical protein
MWGHFKADSVLGRTPDPVSLGSQLSWITFHESHFRSLPEPFVRPVAKQVLTNRSTPSGRIAIAEHTVRKAAQRRRSSLWLHEAQSMPAPGVSSSFTTRTGERE